MNELWEAFAESGSVEAYLRYKENEKTENKNANDCKGLDNKRTDSRGE